MLKPCVAWDLIMTIAVERIEGPAVLLSNPAKIMGTGDLSDDVTVDEVLEEDPRHGLAELCF
jgi:hypothetical protein